MTTSGAAVAASILQGLTTAVAAVDDDGRFVFVNDAFSRMFASAAPVVGSAIFEGGESKADPTFVEALRATILDGQPRCLRSAGEDFGRVFENTIVRHGATTVIEVRDVTDDALEAEDRLRLEAAREVTWSRARGYFMLVDIVGRRVVASDELWRGWPVSALEAVVTEGRILEGLGATTSYSDPWLSPDSALDGRVVRAIAEVFVSGVEQRHRTVVPLTPENVRHIDVEWVPWVVEGVIRGAIMTGHDVTPQVRAEQREMVAAATMQTLLTRLPVTLWQIQQVDATAWPLFPDRREHPDPDWGQHQPMATTFGFLSSESLERLTIVALAMSGLEQQTLTVSSADEQRWMQLSLSAVDPNTGERDSQVLVVVTDVTDELAEAEADRRIDHATHVMRFAQGVAHDFGNVAQVIGGYSEMLAQTQDPIIVEQASKRLRSAAMRAVDVSRRIARIAKVQQVVNGPVDVSDLLLAHVTSLRDQFDPNVHLTVSAEPHLVAYAEPLQVRSAVENLCINATEAMNGSGHVHVSVGSVTSRGRDFVEVAVSDDGPGISPDIIDRVFDPFVTGRPNIGTGLGLYLIQEYLYSVGGQVMVENSDPGATFRMRFQAAREVDARDGSLPRGSAEVVR